MVRPDRFAPFEGLDANHPVDDGDGEGEGEGDGKVDGDGDGDGKVDGDGDGDGNVDGGDNVTEEDGIGMVEDGLFTIEDKLRRRGRRGFNC